jgi:hypothetical protein
MDLEKLAIKANIDEIKNIKNSLKLKERKINSIKKEIEKLYKEVINTQNNIHLETFSLLPAEYHDQLEIILSNLNEEVTIKFNSNNVTIIKQIEQAEKTLEKSRKRNIELKAELKKLDKGI